MTNTNERTSILAALTFPVLVIEQSTFTQDGETIDRLCLDVLGHEMQLLVYDGNESAVIVKFDEQVEQMKLCNVAAFVMAQLQKVKL